MAAAKFDYCMDCIAGQVYFPKMVIIENRRLGVLHRLLQLGVLIFVLYNAVYLRTWNAFAQPVIDSLELWNSRAEGFAEQQGGTAALRHCSDPGSFNYTYAAGRNYSFRRCVQLPDGEAVEKTGANMFILTTVADQNVWRAAGEADCRTLQRECDARPSAAFSNGSAYCECLHSERNFVRMPDDVTIHFNHGYKVTWPTGDTERGRDKALAESKSSGRSWWERIWGIQGEMLTVILKKDGSPCKVGASFGEAKSEWTRTDVLGDGLRGTLKEFIACGGTSLDEPQDELRSFRDDEVGAPVPRGTGMELTFEMQYYNSPAPEYRIKGYGAVCYVTISVAPRWNTALRMAYTVVPDPYTGVGSYRLRTAHGVSLKFDAVGRFAKFDYVSMIAIFINAIVLFSLPEKLIYVIAMFFCGMLSDIYYRAHAQTVHVSKHFSGLAARSISGVATFQALTGEAEPTKGVISTKSLREQLRLVLNRSIKDGTICDEELEGLLTLVRADLDPNDEGGVTFDAFMGAFADSETVEPRTMANFYDWDRRRSLLERAFTDASLRNRRKGQSKVHPVSESSSSHKSL